MSKFAYDTHGNSKELEAAGMQRNQAEAVAISQREGNLATKSDNNEVKSELSASVAEVKFELSALRTEIKFELSALRTEIKSGLSEIKSDISALRTEIKSGLSEIKSERKSQFRWMMSMQILTFLAVLALFFKNRL